jgi:hypothetical protein
MKKSYVFRIAAAAMLIAAAVVLTHASIPDAKGVIHACYSKGSDEGSGRLRVIDFPSASCKPEETPLTWNMSGPSGPTGPQGPIGPTGPQGPAAATQTIFNGNFQHVPLAPFPGVTVARLSLPQGQYLVTAKFRYEGEGTTPGQPAACIFQGAGIGGLDASQADVPIGGELKGQVDGFLMDFVSKQPGADPDVHVQCFGPPDVQIVNSRFVAVPTTLHFQ